MALLTLGGRIPKRPGTPKGPTVSTNLINGGVLQEPAPSGRLLKSGEEPRLQSRRVTQKPHSHNVL